MADLKSLNNRFTDKLRESANIAKIELKYNPSFFIQMLLEYGGQETAKRLINAKKISDGFEKMWENNRLDLTVEAIALEEEWKSLPSVPR